VVETKIEIEIEIEVKVKVKVKDEDSTYIFTLNNCFKIRIKPFNS